MRRSAQGLWDTFLRDNRVVPPVLAVIALVIFSWVIAGTFIGDDAQDRPVSNRQEVAQTPSEADAPAPEIENPNSDSYAAYQSKDPFRQLFQPADASEDTTGDGGSGTEDTGGDGSDDGSGRDDGSGNNNGGGGNKDDKPRQDNTRDPDSPSGNQYDQDERTNRNPNQGNNGNNSSDDDLFNSGGDLLPPPR